MRDDEGKVVTAECRRGALCDYRGVVRSRRQKTEGRAEKDEVGLSLQRCLEINGVLACLCHIYRQNRTCRKGRNAMQCPNRGYRVVDGGAEGLKGIPNLEQGTLSKL